MTAGIQPNNEMTVHKEAIQVRVDNRAAWITLDRPPLNILDIPAMELLGAALDRALPECDFVVFRGAGAKAFCAGADVADHAPDRVGKMLAAFHAVFRRLAAADCMTIAAVQGYCFGGGMELAAFCDFVLATESTQFGVPEIKLGCYPPVAMVILPQLIGVHAALDLILTGRQIAAAEAHRLGLVTRVVSDSDLLAATNALLEELRALSPSVLHLSRKTLRQLHAPAFLQQLADAERVYLSELMRMHDAREGIQAFLEKRKPIWKGE